MDVVTYSLFAYCLTAVISFLMIGLIVAVSSFMNRRVSNTQDNSGEEMQM